MQDGGAGPSRQMDSDPTGQPETYTCHFCLRTFTSEIYYSDHLELHDTGYNYPCCHCNLKFISEWDMHEHVKKYHKNVCLKCNKCDKVFVNLNSLEYHKKMCHYDGKKASKPKQDCGSEGKRKRHEWDNSDADSEDNEQEERPGPFTQMASGSTGDNMQGEGVGSSRQRDPTKGQMASDPTGQPKTYKCNLCAQTFDSLEILCNHLYYHSLENHPCYVCKFKFISNSELRKHCIRVHSDGSLKCDKCGKFFAHFDYFVQHKKRCHNNGKKDTKTKQKSKEKKCDNSDADSKDDKQEERPGPSRQMASGSTGDNMQGEGVGSSRQRDPTKGQMASDPTGQPKTYKCNLCAQTFDSLEILCNHLYYHSLENHPCYVCNFKFISKSDLRKHWNSVHPDVPIKCEKCGKFFAHFKSLARHEKRFHNNDKEDSKTKQKSKRKKCDNSDADSKDDKQEERPGPSTQMASGSTGDNMQGEGVGSSRQKDSDPTGQQRDASAGPSRHIDSDPTGQPETVKCNICLRTFPSENVLKNHLEYHKIAKNKFPCKSCGLRFICNGDYRNHINDKSGPLKCNICGKSLENLHYLNKHKKNCH
ncbi:zinc finger protein 600-like [Nylanderia fulva]|uniref:zinc finger protein 600-like n=1 Tax=Nylanderia fulva TaxID=613905 RepID=UPI0010FB1439|nr:zinc finger protein 600-like [Nylanderia fulva]